MNYSFENYDAAIEISVVGALRVTRSDGTDCTPKGRKACGILALLALTPKMRRTRRWLQDKLWSDRAPEQGSASLRQSLTEIRRVLGDDKQCLEADHQSVSLVADLVSINWGDQDELHGSTCEHAPYELLEGLDIRDPEFEDWLRDQRQQFVNRPTVAPALDAPATRQSSANLANRLVLHAGKPGNEGAGRFLSDGIVDAISKTLLEVAPIDVYDRRDSADNGNGALELQSQTESASLALQSDFAVLGDQQALRIVLKDEAEQRIVWSNVIQRTASEGLQPHDIEVLRHVNDVSSLAIREYLRRGSGEARPAAATLCYQGIHVLFKLGAANFEAADRLFQRAFEIEPRGIYLAWLAYQRTYVLAERTYDCRETVKSEALDFMYRALEMEPYNSYVASLSAHVHTIISRSYVAAFEMAERSVQLNRANPLGWMAMGVAKCHLGKANEGFEDTVRAREIAGAAPFRFHIDALSCIAASMAGRFDDAIRIGEAGHALAPTFAPPLRYLSALYLQSGREDLSQKMVEKMQAIEPDFSYELLAEPSYPAAGLRTSNVLKHIPVRQI